jgi:anaerobic magnesium-protoporphyrin IX monomethyl ester cyclase
MAEIAMDTVQFSAAVPFPGTEYYDYCKKNQLLTANDWRDWLDGGEQSTVVDYPGLGKREIVDYVDRGLKQVYFRPQYMVKFLLDTHSLSDLYRKVRGAKNFMSYLFSKGK